jgi:hypothetical protein
MEVKVGPSKADLQDKVQVGQGAVGPDEKAPPEHRVDAPDPGVDQVSFGLGIVFHGGVSLPPRQRLGSFCPRFEVLSSQAKGVHYAQQYGLPLTALPYHEAFMKRFSQCFPMIRCSVFSPLRAPIDRSPLSILPYKAVRPKQPKSRPTVLGRVGSETCDGELDHLGRGAIGVEICDLVGEFRCLVHRVTSRRHTAVGQLVDFQGANDEHI